MDIDSGENDAGDVADDRHQPQKAADAPATGIDVAALTAKVYRLMLDELRLEQARAARMRNR